MSTVNEVRDEIKAWSETILAVGGVSAAAKYAYTKISPQITNLSSKVDELAKGDGVFGDIELTAEITSDALAIEGEMAAAAALE